MTHAVIDTKRVANPPDTGGPSLSSLMTRGRWIEVGRIVLTGLIALLYWQQLVPIGLLWVAVAEPFRKTFSSASEWFMSVALQLPCWAGSAPFRLPSFTWVRTF